jgi:hypothetical protein
MARNTDWYTGRNKGDKRAQWSGVFEWRTAMHRHTAGQRGAASFHRIPAILWAFLLAFGALALAAGCGGGGGGGGGGGVVPLAMLQGPGYAHCGWLAEDEPMSLVFSHAMDPITLTWNTGAYDGTAVWSAPTKVTITPTTAWPLAAANGLGVIVSDTAGVELTVDPFPRIWSNIGSAPYLYVSGDAGDDANDGTAPTTGAGPVGPVRSIAHGISLATGGVVLVAASKTLVPNTNIRGYDATGSIAMTDRVSLCGGFSATFTTRDPAAHETILVDVSTAGGGSGAPISAVYAENLVSLLGDGTTPATALEGFTLISAGQGANSTLLTQISGESAAVQILAGNLAVRNNKVRMAGAAVSYGIFVGANANPEQALLTGNDIHSLPGALTGAAASEYGLYINGAAPIIDSNYIGGPSGPITYDIWVDATGAGGTGDLVINNNDLDGSASALTQKSYGIWVNGGTVEITKNTIHAGMGSSETNGLRDTSTGSLVQFNTIRGGGGTISRGILTFGSNGTYDANTVSGGSGVSAYGIVVANGPNTLTNNLVSGCGHYGGASPTDCTGVYIAAGTGTTVLNNTINGGSSSNASVGTYDQATGTRISGNLVFNSARGVNCVQEHDSNNAGGNPNFAFQYNNLFDCGANQYYDETLDTGVNLGTTITIGPFTDTTLTTRHNTFDVNPLFVSSGRDPGQVDAADVDWHLRDTSPGEVRGGGETNSCNYPLTDRDGNFRGTDSTAVGGGTSMGAYDSPLQDGGGGC